MSCFSFYVWDDDFGPGFVKLCAYFPYPGKVWCNGHEWAKRQAAKAGIGFTPLSNGFASCDDPAGLQAICDRLGPDSACAAQVHAWTLLDLLKPNSGKTIGLAAGAGLQAVASDACALAGNADNNAGRVDDADRWFKGARELAREAGDWRHSRWLPTRGGRSRHGTRPGERSGPRRSRGVAAFEGAAAFHPMLRPAGCAWLFSQLAAYRGELGDDLSSGRFLEHARANAALVALDDPGWGWWSVHGELGGWDSSRLDVFAAARALGLGRPAEALQLLETARGAVTLPVRRIGLARDVMDACVALGEVEGACVSAIAALDGRLSPVTCLGGRQDVEPDGALRRTVQDWAGVCGVIAASGRRSAAASRGSRAQLMWPR
ncbi:MAG: hypothetical protein ACRDZO_12905 [Egibacteraceae bacterium]